jgi:toxin HigB-1
VRLVISSKKSLALYTDLKGAEKYPPGIVDAFSDAIELIDSIQDDKELLAFRSYNFEKLKGKLKAFHSLRLNRQYRLLVKLLEDKDGKYFEIGDIVDYHK